MSQVTLEGNITADPELRYTGSGKAKVEFTIAVSRSTGRGSDDRETTFFSCVAWDQLAENIADNFFKGTRVIARGELRQRSWETKDGGKRTIIETTVFEAGVSLRFAPREADSRPPAEGRRGQPVDDGEPF